jgi:DNA modification methylase
LFADLPYGITQNEWDKIIPIEDFWEQTKRVCKPTTPIVLTSIQPFTSYLVTSNPDWFRYEIIWEKNKASGFLNSKKQPLRIHENILVFYQKQPNYIPQMTEGHSPKHGCTRHTSSGSNYGKTRVTFDKGGQTSRYPNSILRIPIVNGTDPQRIHPTQKPIQLPEWFIRTYTLPGQLVVDPVAGSGSTLIAAKTLNRRYIGFEPEEQFFNKAPQEIKPKDTSSY